MAVDPQISLKLVQKELEECKQEALRCNWIISTIDETNQTFQVKMKSPIDNEEYLMEIQFDNYNQVPLYIEFIDLTSREKGTRRAYPKSKGKAGSFFHTRPCICHPCSRKATTNGLHKEWKLAEWQKNPKVGTLTNIRAILRAIYARISNEEIYGGRMNG